MTEPEAVPETVPFAAKIMRSKRSGARSGIVRRLARVIFLQLIFISLITVLGVIVSAKVVEGTMIRTALEGEARHYWSQLERNPFHHLPNTDNLLGFISIEGGSQPLPKQLIPLDEGYSNVAIDGRKLLVYVDTNNSFSQERKLYLVFDQENVAKLSFFFGVVPLSLVLIVIYVSGWFSFRQSRKAVSPLVTLASRLKKFHPNQTNLVDLDLDNLKTPGIDDEINVLVNSLNTFTDEINELIQRERLFTRDASHELRTPLTVIQGSAEFLQNTAELNPLQKRAVDRILRTGRDMNALVTALLLLARGSKTLPNIQNIEIGDLVTRQLEQLQGTHNADRHVKVSVEQKHPSIVQATEQLAEAVIGNLLRNAFNYTRKGEVRVLIDGNVLEICNRGEGVTGANNEKMFEPFVRGTSSDSVSGYGVGLDIVKRLCKLFEWQVESEFSVDRGMVFRVTFS